MTGRRTDRRRLRAERLDVAGMDLAPVLHAVPRQRRVVERVTELVEAGVPARTVARGLAVFGERVGEGEFRAGALRRELEAQLVGAPHELEQPRRVRAHHVAFEGRCAGRVRLEL